MKIKAPIISFLVLLGVGLIAENTLNGYIQLSIIYVLVNIIMAMSLNLVNGYTGQFSLGHAGFAAVGAYTSAYLSMHWAPFDGVYSIFSFFIYALIAGGVAALAGYLVGLPSLRLKGDYLAIVTLGFAEIIRVVVLNTEVLGGARGLFGIPGPKEVLLGSVSLSKFIMGFTQASSWVIVCFFVIWRLIQSSFGRTFLSVREDEIAAQAMGIDTTNTKVRAFVLSSFFAGVAGSIFAHYTNYLNPSSFSFLMSINAVIMVVLGGMGSMTGPILAAVIVTALPEVLRPLQEITGKDLRMVVYSLTLILLMLLRPQGLLGQREIFDFFKRKKNAADATPSTSIGGN
jgi:branched-chain amino acid transport system permease protein